MKHHFLTISCLVMVHPWASLHVWIWVLLVCKLFFWCAHNTFLPFITSVMYWFFFGYFWIFHKRMKDDGYVQRLGDGNGYRGSRQLSHMKPTKCSSLLTEGSVLVWAKLWTSQGSFTSLETLTLWPRVWYQIVLDSTPVLWPMTI